MRETKQLTILHGPGAALSIPWRSRDFAEASADVFRRRGVAVEVEKRSGRYVVVEAAA